MGERAHNRDPRMQPAANKPSDEEVAKHNLTHTPYQGWCEHCIAHRARPDRHERTDEARTGKMPTISFDLCYTKALGEGELEADGVSSPWIVMADSQTGYVGCCPLKSKGQIKLATCEIMAFTQNIGHHEVCFLTDNEHYETDLEMPSQCSPCFRPTHKDHHFQGCRPLQRPSREHREQSERLSWDIDGPASD